VTTEIKCRFASQIFLVTILAVASFSSFAQTDNSQEFRIGKVTLNPARQEKKIAPMSEFLATQLDYEKAGTVYARNIQDMVKKFELDEVEYFTGSFWEAAVLINTGVADPVAVKFKERSEGYRSLVVVRANSDIQDLSDLRGKLVAFEDPDSTSAFRIPFLRMREAGLDMVENLDRPNASDTVHYRFSNAEQISSAWLYRDIVDAICISDSDWEKADNVPEFQKDLYRVIYTSEEFPRAVDVVRRNMPSHHKQALEEALLDPSLSLNEPVLLDQYHETSGFAGVDNETLKQLENFASYFTH